LIFVPKIKNFVRKCVVVRLFCLVCMYNIDAGLVGFGIGNGNGLGKGKLKLKGKGRSSK
jgi:hypothetical protein